MTGKMDAHRRLVLANARAHAKGKGADSKMAKAFANYYNQKWGRGAAPDYEEIWADFVSRRPSK